MLGSLSDRFGSYETILWMNIGLTLLIPKWPSWGQVSGYLSLQSPWINSPDTLVSFAWPTQPTWSPVRWLYCSLSFQTSLSPQHFFCKTIFLSLQSKLLFPFYSIAVSSHVFLRPSRWLGLISPRKWRLSSMNSLNFPHLSLQNIVKQFFFSLSLLFLHNKPGLPIFLQMSFHFLLLCCKSYNSGCHHLSSSNYHCLQSCPPTCQSNLHSIAKVIYYSNHVTPLFLILYCLKLTSKILNRGCLGGLVG